MANLFYNYISFAANIVLPLAYVPYIYQLFGPDINGRIAWITSIAFYFSLFAGMSVSPYAARKLAAIREDTVRYNYEARAFLSFAFFNSLIVYSIFMIFALVIAPHQLLEYSLIGLNILTVGVNVDYVYQAREEFKSLAMRGIILKILTVVLVFVCIKKPNDMHLYLGLSAVAILSVNVYYAFRAKVFPNLHKYLRQFVKIFNELKTFFIMSLTMTFYSRIHLVILGAITPPNESGQYSFTQKFGQLALSLIQILLTTLSPSMVTNYAQSPEQYLKKVNRGFRANLLIVGFVWSVFFSCSVQIENTFGKEQYEPSALLLAVYSFILLFSGISNYIATLQMLVQKRESEMLVVALLASLFSVPLNFILSPRLGALGAIISYLCAELLILCIMVYKNLRSGFALSWKLAFVAKSVVFPAISVIVLSKIIPEIGWGFWNLLAKALVLSIVWIFAIFMINIDVVFRKNATQNGFKSFLFELLER